MIGASTTHAHNLGGRGCSVPQGSVLVPLLLFIDTVLLGDLITYNDLRAFALSIRLFRLFTIDHSPCYESRVKCGSKGVEDSVCNITSKFNCLLLFRRIIMAKDVFTT